MKRLVYISLTAVAIAMATSCTNQSDGSDSSNDTVQVNFATPDAPQANEEDIKTVTGEVTDGARRSIELKDAQDNTYYFELDSSDEVSYEVGDQITVRYRDNGDQNYDVIEVTNDSEQK